MITRLKMILGCVALLGSLSFFAHADEPPAPAEGASPAAGAAQAAGTAASAIKMGAVDPRAAWVKVHQACIDAASRSWLNLGAATVARTATVGLAGPGADIKCKSLTDACESADVEINKARERYEATRTGITEDIKGQTMSEDSAGALKGMQNTTLTAVAAYESEINNHIEVLRSRCDDLCGKSYPGACATLNTAITEAMSAEKAEQGAWYDWLVSGAKGLGAALLPAALQMMAECYNLKGDEKEACLKKQKEDQTQPFWCPDKDKEDKPTGAWTQFPMTIADAKSKGCRSDKPEGAKEKETEKPEAPQVAGMKGEGGDTLGAKPGGEGPAKEEKKDEFAGTDTEQDPKKPGQKGAGSVGRGSDFGGGFGGRPGFAPSGVLSSEGRKGQKGEGRSGYGSGGDIGYGGGGGRGGYDGGRQPMDTLAVDAGRLSKHKATTYEKTETTKEELTQPAPEKTIFERVQEKYTAYSSQFTN